MDFAIMPITIKRNTASCLAHAQLYAAASRFNHPSPLEHWITRFPGK